MKRLIYNIRHPEAPDENVISSGVEAFGWLWAVERSGKKGTDMKKTVPLIEIKNCVMEFPGVKALNQVNFTLMPGECHALVGENGAGKSTLQNVLLERIR